MPLLTSSIKDYKSSGRRCSKKKYFQKKTIIFWFANPRRLHDGEVQYLESAATILYFFNCEKNFTLTDAISKLNIIKPHIDSEVVENAYNDIMEWDLIQKDNLYGLVIIDDDLDSIKEILNKKINNYIDYFNDFGRCNNSIVVAGSLDYLKKVLIHETLGLEMKNDLLKLISGYVDDVEKIYNLCGGNGEVFGYMNLDSLENRFDRIQDYISQELDIFPRLDDEGYEEIVCRCLNEQT